MVTAAGLLRVLGVGCVAAVLANCSASSNIDSKYGVAASPRVVSESQSVPKGGGRRQVGKPYTIAGRTFVPREDPNYDRQGIASWYGRDFHGRLTANGEVFDKHALTAAHPTLPLPSYVRVTNVDNGRSVTVRVNDRGPFHGNRIIDVSRKTSELLGFDRRGTARVRVTYEGPASTDGSNDHKLLATYREHGRNAPPPSTFALGPNTSPAPQAVAFAQAPAQTPAPARPAETRPVTAAAQSWPAQQVAMAHAAIAPMPVPSPMPRPVDMALASGGTTPSAAPVQSTPVQNFASASAGNIGEPLPLFSLRAGSLY